MERDDPNPRANNLTKDELRDLQQLKPTLSPVGVQALAKAKQLLDPAYQEMEERDKQRELMKNIQCPESPNGRHQYIESTMYLHTIECKHCRAQFEHPARFEAQQAV